MEEDRSKTSEWKEGKRRVALGVLTAVFKAERRARAMFAQVYLERPQTTLCGYFINWANTLAIRGDNVDNYFLLNTAVRSNDSSSYFEYKSMRVWYRVSLSFSIFLLVALSASTALQNLFSTQRNNPPAAYCVKPSL